MIKIVTVENRKLEKEFVLFPFDLYKDCDYWVPPIIKEELDKFLSELGISLQKLAEYNQTDNA